MKNIALILIIAGMAIASCKKEDSNSQVSLLTGPVWTSDSLLANGVDASGPDGMLKNFKGDAKFNEDGTGYFGIYEGTWRFAYDNTQLVISSDSLAFPITTKIAELTAKNLKVTTSYPNLANPSAPTNIRMTFKAK
jgi:hypothetical protein